MINHSALWNDHRIHINHMICTSMSPEELDILRTLCHVFKSEDSLEIEDVERILSFDLRFLTPDESEQAVRRLIETGWLEAKDEILTSTIPLSGVKKPPLSWMPRPIRLLNPVNYNQEHLKDEPKSEPNEEQTIREVQPQMDKKSEETVNENDPRSGKERLLIGYISRKTGLAKEEIIRRRDRKNKALEPSTTWICLALIAREQGLEMSEIIQSLSSF